MVDRLMAWLRSLPTRFLNWWEKFTSRQKIAISTLAIGAIAALIILVVVLTKPKYVTIYTAENATEAKEVMELLDSNEIGYKTDKEGLVISIQEKDYTDANLVLGSNKIYADSYSISNVTSGGFSTTEADKQKKYIVYLESLMRDSIETYSFVKKATVQLNIPTDDGTLIAQNKQKSASIILDLKGECDTDTAAAIAQFVATALGNESTANVTILDTDGRLLFSGAEESTVAGQTSSQLALRDKISNIVSNDVRRVLTGTNQFSAIEVAPNIVLDNSYTEFSKHEYWPDGENPQGVLAKSDIYESTNEGGVSGEPGTDSNTGTTYVYEDGEFSNSHVKEESYDYLPNESTTLQKIPAGAIKYDESSITVTCIKYNVLTEKDAKNQGLLDGTNWEKYKAATKASDDYRKKITVDNEIYSAVSTATGIATDKITILAYEEPLFIDEEPKKVKASDILTIVLIVLILGLLAFVILRSMKQTKVEEEEPEISIEEILKSTPPEELEEIGVEDKSEARKIVEKFVEDNPDAAANLLRNWLSEDWQ